MNERKLELAAVGVLLAALFSADVRAEQPGNSSKGDGKPGPAAGKPEVKAAGVGNPGKGTDGNPGKGTDGNPGKGADGNPGKGTDGNPGKGANEVAGQGDSPAKSHEGNPGKGEGRHGEMRLLRDELKAGKIKKEDLEGRLAKLRESNKERQDNHRAALKARWGEHLAKPDTHKELELHERRMAKLNRILLLAQSERKGADAEKVTARVEKLIAVENARHEKRMAQISGATPPTPASPPAAVNVEVTK